MRKYVVQECENFDYYTSYDVVLKEDNGFTWICECGDIKSPESKRIAKLIARLLNEHEKKIKAQ